MSRSYIDFFADVCKNYYDEIYRGLLGQRLGQGLMEATVVMDVDGVYILTGVRERQKACRCEGEPSRGI